MLPMRSILTRAVVLGTLVGISTLGATSCASAPTADGEDLEPSRATGTPSGDAPLDDIPHVARPDGGILTGGQPSRHQLEAAIRSGYRTVVSLRAAGEPFQSEEPGWVRELGGTWVAIPIAGSEDFTRDTVERLDRAIRTARTEDSGIFVHCASSNRVGALFALRAAWIEGADADDAIATGKAAGLRSLEPTVRELLD